MVFLALFWMSYILWLRWCSAPLHRILKASLTHYILRSGSTTYIFISIRHNILYPSTTISILSILYLVASAFSAPLLVAQALHLVTLYGHRYYILYYHIILYPSPLRYEMLGYPHSSMYIVFITTSPAIWYCIPPHHILYAAIILTNTQYSILCDPVIKTGVHLYSLTCLQHLLLPTLQPRSDP